MPTFAHDGEEFELITNIDDLEVGDAEVVEEALGVDLRNLSDEALSRQLQVFLLISMRRRRPDATLADTKRIKLGPVLAAFSAGGTDVREPASAAPSEGAELLSPTSAGSEQLPA